MENERVFSIAGIVTEKRRNRLMCNSMDNIMQLYYNYDLPQHLQMLENEDLKDLMSKCVEQDQEAIAVMEEEGDAPDLDEVDYDEADANLQVENGILPGTEDMD